MKVDLSAIHGIADAYMKTVFRTYGYSGVTVTEAQEPIIGQVVRLKPVTSIRVPASIQYDAVAHVARTLVEMGDERDGFSIICMRPGRDEQTALEDREV